MGLWAGKWNIFSLQEPHIRNNSMTVPYLFISDSISLSFASRSLLHSLSFSSKYLCNKLYIESIWQQLLATVQKYVAL